MLFAWILLGFLLTVVLLLAVPVELSFVVRLQAGQRMVNGRMQWLFGLVRVKIPDKSKAKAEARPKPKKKKPARRPRRGRLSPMSAFSVEGIVHHVLTLVRRLLTAVHIHHLDIQSRLGLGDPADTGRAWALIGPLSLILDTPRSTRVDIQPEFTDAVLEFNSSGRIRIVPLEYVAVMVVFLLSPTTFRAYRAMRS